MFQARNINNHWGLPDEEKVLFLSQRSQGGNVLVVYKAAHDPPGLCADSPGTLAVRLGTAPLFLQVAWEAELPSRGEGLGLLDNPKSAWSSHAKAAASGKDTRVLNLQNKERRTQDSRFFPPRLGHEGAHICAL